MRIEIDLPFPPSTNRLWRISGRRLVNSVQYELWKSAANAEFYVQFAKKRPQRLGKFTVSIILDQSKRGRSDGDNRLKALLDFLQRAGLVANDSGCDRGEWSWGTAPAGCRIVLEGEPHEA
jgi:crossover junction endodeoxyribonuclease RusA